ncbi:MAG: HAMP domain-containing sensor histidine kinase [Campylobacterota bacterium]|nr:HAMP domain-containing sensor histidine kinase [Campylobacterota bacterium]
MKLLYQILLLTLLPLFIILASHFYQSLELNNVLEEKLENSIKNIKINIQNKIDNKISATIQICDLFNKSDEILSAIENRDADFLYQRSRHFIDSKIISNVIFIDKNGLVVSRGTNEYKFNDHIQNEKINNLFKNKEIFTGVMKFDNKYQYITLKPAYKFDVEFIGYIGIGQIINEAMINKIIPNNKHILEYKFDKISINNFKKDYILDPHKFTKIDIEIFNTNKKYILNMYLNLSKEKILISKYKQKQHTTIILMLILSTLFVILLVKRILKPLNVLNKYLLQFIKKELTLNQLIELIENSKDTNNELNILKQSALLTLKDLKSTQTKLINSNIKEENAHKIKNDFLSNMSHEIRTPMNEISGFIAILLNMDIKKGEKKYLSKIDNSLDILNHTINDILEISKIESGDLILNNHFHILQNTVFDIKKLFKKQNINKKLDFILKLDEEIFNYSFKLDEERLNKVIKNLLINAIKFTNNGFIKMTIDMKKLNKIYSNLTISIQDTGIGIDESDFETIFKSFTQVFNKNEVKHIHHGSGLGLSISKQIINLMNGSIDVKSKRKKGSTFIINLTNVKYNTIDKLVTDL